MQHWWVGWMTWIKMSGKASWLDRRLSQLATGRLHPIKQWRSDSYIELTLAPSRETTISHPKHTQLVINCVSHEFIAFKKGIIFLKRRFAKHVLRRRGFLYLNRLLLLSVPRHLLCWAFRLCSWSTAEVFGHGTSAGQIWILRNLPWRSKTNTFPPCKVLPCIA